MRKFFGKMRDKAEGAAIALTAKAKAMKENISGNEPSGFVGLILVTLVIVTVLIVVMKAFFPELVNALTGKATTLIGGIDDSVSVYTPAPTV